MVRQQWHLCHLHTFCQDETLYVLAITILRWVMVYEYRLTFFPSLEYWRPNSSDSLWAQSTLQVSRMIQQTHNTFKSFPMGFSQMNPWQDSKVCFWCYNKKKQQKQFLFAQAGPPFVFTTCCNVWTRALLAQCAATVAESACKFNQNFMLLGDRHWELFLFHCRDYQAIN